MKQPTYNQAMKKPLPHSPQNRLKLLHEVDSSLGVLLEFNHTHEGRWTPDEFAEYKALYLVWTSAVNDLTDFENNIPPENRASK
ncbi:MAG TPA: hypothetical protein VMX38_10990 [Verrucomicrobiae bacterium]|nr:hypothetical protein [Verrucomicrobiae bacterium]